jgi:sulfite exporter TauE/SafE
MIELPFIFLGGLLGSAHCVGMCGGFALTIGLGAPSFASNLARQVAYTLGRVLTYSFFGVVAGYAGLWLSRKAGTLVNVQAVLSMLAGGLLLFQGLLALGLFPWRLGSAVGGGGVSCLAGGFVGPFLRARGSLNALIAGMLTGFLPCGLVYGFLGMASSTASVLHGLLTMAAFGAGTGPIMILTGAGGSLISLGARRRLLRTAAICVMIAGLISLARGVMFLQFSEAAPLHSCPFCGPTGE